MPPRAGKREISASRTRVSGDFEACPKVGQASAVAATTAVTVRAAKSDARIPGISPFRRGGAQTFAESLQIVSDCQARDEFDALVTELARDTHAKRTTVANRKLAAIQAIGEKGLRVQCIGHVNAIPPI